MVYGILSLGKIQFKRSLFMKFTFIKDKKYLSPFFVYVMIIFFDIGFQVRA